MECTLVTLFALLAAGSSLAQDGTDAERLRRLEEKVRRQQEEIDELKKKEAARDGGEFSTSFSEGLHFRTRDGATDIHFGGRVVEQFRDISDRPAGSRTQPNTFFIREAMIQADGTLWRDWGFKVQGNFPSSFGSPPNPPASLANGYFEWKRVKQCSVAFGQFKTPISQETALTSPLFTDPIERSILSKFVPSFELGIMVYGTIENGLLSYQLAFTNGRAHLINAGRARNDDNDGKEGLLHLMTMPWAEQGDSLLRGLRLGVYGSLSHLSDAPMPGAFDIATPALNVTYLQSTNGFFDGERTRLGAELSWALGPCSLRAEYLRRTDGVTDGTIGETMPIHAWYVQGTWIITGEDKVVENRIVPASPFDPGNGDWGALEAVFQTSRATIGRQFVDVGNTFAGQSNRILTLTAGFNWYPVKNVRIAANYVREDYRDEVTFAVGDQRRVLHGFLARFQIDF